VELPGALETAVPETAPTVEPASALPLREQVIAFRRARALPDREAVAAWREILSRWPDSPLCEEASAALVDALVRLGKRPEARRAAHEFVDRFPASSRADAMREIAEELR